MDGFPSSWTKKKLLVEKRKVKYLHFDFQSLKISGQVPRKLKIERIAGQQTFFEVKYHSNPDLKTILSCLYPDQNRLKSI